MSGLGHFWQPERTVGGQIHKTGDYRKVETTYLKYQIQYHSFLHPEHYENPIKVFSVIMKFCFWS